MSQTILGTTDDKITINGELTYSDIPGTRPEHHGLLMNARFIQGILTIGPMSVAFRALAAPGMQMKIQTA